MAAMPQPLARMLHVCAGEDTLYATMRMVRFASGLASPVAVQLAIRHVRSLICQSVMLLANVM